jgi:SAM-dependent methyltransferase
MRVMPTAEAVEAAAEASPLVFGPGMSELADLDELKFREEVEAWDDPATHVPALLARKELPRRLEHALLEARLQPAGTIVDLGAGMCWLSSELAKRTAVERVIAIEFSQRRLVELAPVALATLGAPARKIERRVADFYAHGLEPASADWVFMDAAFHHAADPVRLARVAFDLLRPGGRFVLFREPTLSLLKRTRDHGEEAGHGDFEHEYTAGGYQRILREAGFDASRHRASGGWSTPRARALLRPPLKWFNGVLFSEFTYVGTRP